MPELPEAETIARGLRERVLGHAIESVEVVHEDVLVTDPGSFQAGVEGRRIEAVGRRGKKVVIDLGTDRVLVVNLGMTGRLIPYLPEAFTSPPASTHPALRFHFDCGGRLIYDDVRRFGTVECLETAEWVRRSRELGPEPLSRGFTAASLQKGLERSRSPIRSWLLDQRKLAGVGNIYANESLWRARVHPARWACQLDSDEVERLHRAIRAVLREAVSAEGTTLRDYRTVDGKRGEFAGRLRVYGREGSACRRCRTTIERIVFGGRSAFLCPRCQPTPTPPHSGESGARRIRA